MGKLAGPIVALALLASFVACEEGVKPPPTATATVGDAADANGFSATTP